MTISILTLTESAVYPYLQEMAALRLSIFREYPYLYDGSLDHELDYLQRYGSVPGAAVLLALDGNRVVGAATGIPMAAEESAFTAPLIAAGWEPESIFYIGELLFFPGYRGQGFGSRLLEKLEHHARGLDFATLACATVRRPSGHPRQPADYLSIDGFCLKHGFTLRNELVARLTWPDIGGGSSEKEMVFWLKRLKVTSESATPATISAAQYRG